MAVELPTEVEAVVVQEADHRETDQELEQRVQEVQVDNIPYQG